MKLKLITTIVATLALAVSVIGQDTAREQKLQQAIDLLETKGDAARAMPLLEEVAKSADQALAARGLLYLGQAQETQGKDQARRTYERLIQQYASQSQIVAQAQVRLSALGAQSTRPTAAVAHRMIWTMPERSYAYGNVSRNGHLFLYTDIAGDLQLRDLERGATRILVKHEGESYAESGALSVDGQQVAFGWYNDSSSAYELHVGRVGATGLINRRTVPGVKGDWIGVHDWSVDGRLVALDYYPQDGGVEIDVVDVSNGSRRVLKTGQRVDRLAFSPDSRWLAAGIRSHENGALDIHLLPLVPGGAEMPAVVHRAEDVLVGWTPDGRLLFTSDRTGATGLFALALGSTSAPADPVLVRANVGTFESRGIDSKGALFSVVDPEPATSDIHTASFDFTTGQWIERPREVVREYFVGGNQSPEWSPDGRTLAYITRRGATRSSFRVHLRSSDTGRTRELRPKLLGVSSLRWTSKGDALILTGSSYESRGGLWLMDLDTGDLTALDSASNFGPSTIIGWTADGRSVFLRRNVSITESVIVEKSVESGIERELVRGARSGNDALQGGRVTPDGRRLIYRKAVTPGRASAFAIVAFVERHLETGTERELARGYLAALNISPDGVYFGTGLNDPGTGVRSFGVMPTSGGQFRELIKSEIPKDVISGAATTNVLSMAGWAADSRSFFVRKVVGTATELWWVSIDGTTEPRRVFENWNGVNIRVHPDGRRFVFETRQQPTRASELWVFENLLPPETRKSGARP